MPLYAEFDRAGRASCSSAAGASRTPGCSTRWAGSTPSPSAVPDALLALGELHEAAGRPADAAQAYKRLLALAPPPTTPAPGPSGGWPAPTRRRTSGSRPATPISRSSPRFPDVRLEERGTDARSATSSPASWPARPFARMIARPLASRACPSRWSAAGSGRSSGDAAARSPPTGVPPSAAVEPDLPRARDARSARSTPPSGESPLVGRPGRRRRSGSATSPTSCSPRPARAWSRSSLDDGADAVAVRPRRLGRRPRRGAEPVRPRRARPSGERGRARRRSTTSRSSAAGSSASGATRSCSPSTATPGWSTGRSRRRGGAINPKLWIGPERVVLQVHKPTPILVLETDSGRRLAEYPLAEGEELDAAPGADRRRPRRCSSPTAGRSRSST